MGYISSGAFILANWHIWEESLPFSYMIEDLIMEHN